MLSDTVIEARYWAEAHWALQNVRDEPVVLSLAQAQALLDELNKMREHAQFLEGQKATWAELEHEARCERDEIEYELESLRDEVAQVDGPCESCIP